MIPEDTLLFIEPHPPCGSPTTELLQLIRRQPARVARLGFSRCRASPAWKKCADKTRNHLEGIGREARRAPSVVRQNSQAKLI